MTLKEIREDYVRYSTNVSELSRNLAYAGIGIVWILLVFKRSTKVSENLTWQNPGQLFVAQELINKVKLKCCGI